jgi:hypothetical protein
MATIKRIILSVLFYIFFGANIALAAGPLSGPVVQDSASQMGAFVGSAGFVASVEAPNIIGDVIQVFLSLLSMIFIILILYAGYNWMTAGGDEQKVTKAKDTIYRAVIGLIVIISAFVITYFVFNALPFNASSTTTVEPADSESAPII